MKERQFSQTGLKQTLKSPMTFCYFLTEERVAAIFRSHLTVWITKLSVLICRPEWASQNLFTFSCSVKLFQNFPFLDLEIYYYYLFFYY